MAIKTPAQIQVDSNLTYPDNTTGQITPAGVRTLNTNWIDSIMFLSNTASYNVGTASLALNALTATSASFASRANTATTSTSSLTSISASYAGTASLLLGSVASASYAATANTALTATSSISSSYATNAVNAETASIAFLAQFAAIATSALTASFASTASFLLGGVASSSYSVTSSLPLNGIVNAVSGVGDITFTYGNGTQFTVVVPVSGSIATASLALNSELLDGLDSTAFVLASNFSSFSSSLVSDYATKAQVTSSVSVLSGSVQVSQNALSSSLSSRVTSLESFSSSLDSIYATDASVTASISVLSGSVQASQLALSSSVSTRFGLAPTLAGNNTFTGNNIFGNITASNAQFNSASIEYLSVVYQTSSIVYSSGSNQFGDAANDVQTLYGTVDIKTGPLLVTGSMFVSGNINMLNGADIVTHHVKAVGSNGVEIQNQSAGVVGLFGAGGSLGTTFYGQVGAVSFVGSGSGIVGVVSSSYAQTASFYGGTVATASFAINANNAYAATSSLTSISSSNALTASYVTTAQSASNTPNAIVTASVVASTITFTKGDNTSFNITVAQSGSVASASYASYAENAGTASVLLGTVSTASYAINANNAYAATSSISSSYAATASVLLGNVESASFALTASSVNTLNQDVLISGSLAVTGSQVIHSGSLILYSYISNPANNLPFQNLIIQPINASGNIISTRPTTLNSGSFIVSGSNNIVSVSAASNSTVTNGGTTGFNGTNAYLTALPQITGSNPNVNVPGLKNNRYVPNISNANVNNTITVNDNRGSEATVPVTVSNSNINGTIAFTLTSGSIAVTGANVFGALTISNNRTGSGAQADTLTSTVVGGASNVIQYFSTGSTFAGINDSIIVGISNRVLVTGSSAAGGTSTSSPRLNATSILGSNLIATGSGATGNTTAMTIVGTFNEGASGLLNDAKFTRFAVGTGDAAATRRTSFHVSASGLTTVANGLNVSQSLVITGSVNGLVVSQSIASNTSSLDFGVANFYTSAVTSTTFFNITNPKPGETVNVLLTTVGAATASFSSNVKQPSGSAYTPSAGDAKQDILTFVSWDGSTVYLANVKNLI